jgi:prevent-host-death family protein
MNVRTLKSDEARQGWRDLLDAVSNGDDVVIERYNKPVAALISYEDFVALQETLDDLRLGRRAQAVYEAWKKDPSRARPWEEIEAELINEDLLDEQTATLPRPS